MTISIIGIVSGLLILGIVKAKQKSQSTACKGNLRQLGLAVRVYADDYRGRLPANGSIPTVFKGFPADVLKCPSDEEHFESTGTSYDWNQKLNGRLLHGINILPNAANPLETALLYDHSDWHGFKNAVFGDGHVEQHKAK